VESPSTAARPPGERGAAADAPDEFQERWGRVLDELRGGVNVEDNFRRLHDQFHRAVFWFFMKRGFRQEDCHDFTQETFLRVYRGIGGLRENARFKTWLFEIAANIWRNALRNRFAEKRNAPEVSLDASPDGSLPPALDAALLRDGDGLGPLELVERREQVEALRAAIAELPAQMRRCVLLRLQQDRDYREIAVLMRVSIETVKSHLHQAQGRLRLKLAERFELPDLCREEKP
jgi:RNA polymerase sigma factor (sigma-70 family)